MPQNRSIHSRVGKLLCHQCPNPEAPKRQHNTKYAGRHGAAKSRKEEALELHRLFDVGFLHVLQPCHDKRQPQHPQNRRQPGFPEHRRQPRRQQKQRQIQKQAEEDIKIKDRRKIQVVRILFLDEGVGHAAVNKYQQNSGNHRHLADGAVHGWLQKPLQNDGHQKGDNLRTAALQKTPEKAGKDFPPCIVLSFHTLYSASR